MAVNDVELILQFGRGRQRRKSDSVGWIGNVLFLFGACVQEEAKIEEGKETGKQAGEHHAHITQESCYYAATRGPR